jgi:four helix bundle protein
MTKFQKFEDIQAWQLAREIAMDIWTLTETTPLKEDFALRNQTNRSSGSIMDNIAEGAERNGNREFVQFLSIAKASCGEVRSQLYRAFDRKHITEEQLNSVLEKTVLEGKKLEALISYLNKSDQKGSKFTQSATPNPQLITRNPHYKND